MAQVSVTINDRNYQIACDDGQEDHLLKLANYVNTRVSELVASVGQVGDARLLVMVSLLIADEMSDAYSELEEARSAGEGVAALMATEDHLVDKLDVLTKRIETIAESVKQA